MQCGLCLRWAASYACLRWAAAQHMMRFSCGRRAHCAPLTLHAPGAYNFWDKDSKQRLKAMQKCSMPIPCGDFNRCAAGAQLARHCRTSATASLLAGSLWHTPPYQIRHAAPPLPLARRDGSIYAYAVSYDWSRGYSEYNPTTAKNYILLHAPQEAEVKSRTRPATGRR